MKEPKIESQEKDNRALPKLLFLSGFLYLQRHTEN